MQSVRLSYVAIFHEMLQKLTKYVMLYKHKESYYVYLDTMRW